ncbi:MAG: hypothetical protein PHT35_08795 [Bacteroidales bacterium]|nr:hypothetical protein [Bacteroidales bacterium]MDD3522169.1 hypothetical protein [Bacteroidales bacterium]MDD4031334.1 hypothetical protein [Bacteroidales bacterium]MDD4435921.1 hypothetical protein [Bacteroidales bacterium]
MALLIGGLLIGCTPQDNVFDPEGAGDYQTYGIYRLGDTLTIYRQFADQWSILTYDTEYDFRIQNYGEKKVVTISGVPLNPESGSTFSIEVNVFGFNNISGGNKNVTVVRNEEHRLLLYDSSNKTSYLVYN